MAGQALALAMQISANTAGLAQAVKDVESKLDRMSASAEKAAGRMKVLTTLSIGRAFVDGIQVAANAFTRLHSMTSGFVAEAAGLEQAIGRAGAVFGESAEGVFQFAESTREIGIAKKDAIEAVSTMGNLFTAFGLGKEEAAGMSIELTKLAADMAALNNTSTDQALRAISSGLAGEQEPLKRYGVVLTEAVLKNEAFNRGLIQTRTAALDPLTRSLMAYEVLMTQTANAQGHAARESNTLDGVQKRMASNFKDIKTDIGQSLVPAYRAFGDAVQGVLPSMKDATDAFAEFAKGVDFKSIFDSGAQIVVDLVGAFTSLLKAITPVVAVAFPLLASLTSVIADNFDSILAAVIGGAAAYGVYTVAVTLASIGMAGFTASLVAARAAMVLFLSSTGIGIAVAAVGALAGTLINLGLSSSDAADGTKDLEEAQKSAAAASEEIERKLRGVQGATDKTAESAKRAAEAIYKMKAVTDRDINQGQIGKLEGEYKRLAEIVGGESKLPEELRRSMQQALGGVDLVNDFGGRQEDIDLMVKTNAELLRITRDRLGVEEAIASARSSIEEPQQALAAIYAEMQTAQQAFLEAQRRGDVQAMASMEERFGFLQKASVEAKNKLLESRGLDPKDFKGPEVAADAILNQFEQVRSMVNEGLLSQVDLETYTQNLKQKHDELLRSIQSSVDSAGKSSVGISDVRTREGYKEFIRIANGGGDNGTRIAGQQLSELRGIRQALGRPQIVDIGA
jgi:hypothetical protein